MKNLLLKIFLGITIILTSISSFANWDWLNLADDVVNTPYFKVIQVYSGQQFSIKWDSFKHGAFLAGNAIVRFRNITDYDDIVGVINNYPDTQGVKIRSTNWVYANVYKSGTLIVYAPFSKSITFTPDLFLSNKTSISAWEINSPDITNNYRIKSFFSNSKGTNPFPNYFKNLILKDEVPTNYGKLKKFDNIQAYVVGINIDSDLVTSGSKINFAPYTIGTLNKYYFSIFEKQISAYRRFYSNPDLSTTSCTFGLKSVMAVFLISDIAYIDKPESVYPPTPKYYYEVDNSTDIKNCHFWSYAKMFKPDKYAQIKDYKGYDALFPIGFLKFKTFRFAYPTYYSQADEGISRKCAEYDTVFYNPVSGQNEIQEFKDGFVEYYYADRLTPVER